MPRFVGHRPQPSDRPYPEVGGEHLVQLTWPQAERVRRAGGQIYYLLNTSDRGARGRRAKRWYMWYASMQDVLCSDPTDAMYHSVAHMMLDGRIPRDMMEWLHAQALQENERRDALRARIDALQTHLRPTCLRVVAGQQIVDLSMRRATTLFVVERLHDVGGTLTSELPSDLEAAIETVKNLQDGHDQVYHADLVRRVTSA
jgi:hypothetical protein